MNLVTISQVKMLYVILMIIIVLSELQHFNMVIMIILKGNHNFLHVFYLFYVRIGMKKVNKLH